MKLPSLKKIVSKGSEAFLRFPLPILCAVAASGIGMYVAGFDYLQEKKADIYFKLIFTCALGVFLFIAATLFFERRKAGMSKKIIFSAVGVVALGLYFFSLPEKVNLVMVSRFFLLGVGFHALVAVTPYLFKNDNAGFWQYNKALFLRFVTAVLYSVVLYVGLSLALLAIDNLFGVNINYKYYLRLWIFITGVFNTWFFLSGVPKDFGALSHDGSYPVGLKIFSQYVLLSLVSVYLLILYVYGAKILIRWQLPVGWVSYMVSCFAALGIFSLLLLHPLKMKGDNKFINLYTRWFYIVLFPLIVLLFTAIIRRISDYGITENRYFVFVTAVWLACIAAYLLFNRIRNIIMVPATLAVCAFLVSFGPWSAFSVSLRSQLNRFEQLVTNNRLLVNGKIVKLQEQLDFKTRQQLSTVVEYITDYRDYKLLQPYFKQNLDSLFPDSAYTYKPTEIMKLMGQDFISKWQREDYSQEYFSLSSDRYNQKNVFSIEGYQYAFLVNEYYGVQDTSKDSTFVSIYTLGDETFRLYYSSANGQMAILGNDSTRAEFNIHDIVKQVEQKFGKNEYNIKTKDMIFTSENERLKVMMVFSNLNGNYKNSSRKILVTNIQSEFYLMVKPLIKVIDKSR